MDPKKIAATLIELLKKQSKLELLPQVIDELQKFHSAEAHTVLVESANDLDPQTRQDIVELLTHKLGHQPSINFKTDATLIAGVRIHINDELIDASIRHNLEEVFKKIH